MNDTIIKIPASVGVVAEKMPNHRLSFHFNDHFSVDVILLTIFAHIFSVHILLCASLSQLCFPLVFINRSDTVLTSA